MLMTYVGQRSRRPEVLWNSRDGITPFAITSAWEPREEMAHEQWSQDRRVPTYVPPIGSRIFVDLTLHRALEEAGRTIEQTVYAQLPPARLAEAVDAMARNLLMTMPDIIVVTEEVRERFQRLHDESLRRER